MVTEYPHEERFHKRDAHVLQMLYSMSYTSQSELPEFNHRDTSYLRSRCEEYGPQAAHDRSARLLWRRVCNPDHLLEDDLVPYCQLSTLWTILRHDVTDGDQVVEKQEDASEWLTWLLTAIEEQLGDGGFSTIEQERFKWLFELKQTSRVLCSKCNWPVQRRERSTPKSDSKHLVLEIPGRAGVSAFAARATPVPLKQLVMNSMAALYCKNTCTRCGEGIQNIAQEIKRIRRFPELLILNLSRSERIRGATEPPFVKKKHDAVSIPEHLDLSQCLEPSSFGAQSKVQYRLRGVVSHQGLAVDSGHYISYIRVDHEDGYEWLELNDRAVKDCSMYRFNDSYISQYKDEEKFNNRFEPYIMIYELDHGNSVMLPGRQLRNVDEGEDVDERPTEWLEEADNTAVARLGTVAAEPSNAQVTITAPHIDKGVQSSDANATATASHPPGVNATSGTQPIQSIAISSAWPVILAAAVNALPKITFSGFDNETTFPQAEVDLTLRIDGAEFKMPKRFINHFNRNKQRQVEIEATIKVPTGSAQDVQGKKQDQLEIKELDLARVFIDARIERKQAKLLPSTAQQSRQAESGARRGLRSQIQDQDLLGADDLDKTERQSRLKNKQTWSSRWKVVQAAPKTKSVTSTDTKGSTKGSKKDGKKKKK